MLKICAVIRAKEGMSREDFLQYWCGEHPEVVRALPGVRKYIQNVPVQHQTTWPFDALAEVYFDSMRDIAVAFSSPEADTMREHEKLFVGDIQWIIAEAHEVPLHLGGADSSMSPAP